MHFDATFFTAVAFVLFLAVLGYVGVHRTLLSSLDRRRERIQSELDEARRLRDDAAKLLADYQRRQGEAQKEAEGIIAGAQAEAERLAAEADAKLQDFVARRTKMAEQKIAQAEAQALADVRNAATEAAVAAAEQVLAQSAKGALAEALVAQGIEDVKSKLN
jgi:F-type H+-transporting ATPase subunit b